MARVSQIQSRDDDPLHVWSVSGFYGPGAWVAWILSLASTWYTFACRSKSTENLDLISSLLYTNWAALDLLIRIFRGSVQEAYGSFAAAVTVTVWGTCHIGMLSFFVWQADTESTRRRNSFLLLGSIVPTLALAALLISPSTTFFNMTEASLIRMSPPRYNFDGFLEPRLTIFGELFHISPQVNLAICWRGPRPRPIFPLPRRLISMLACALVLIIALLTSYAYTPCFIVPCAPQGITDWDQLFPVLYAVLALSYQIVPDVWPWVKAAWWRAVGYVVWGDSRSLERRGATALPAEVAGVDWPRPLRRLASMGV